MIKLSKEQIIMMHSQLIEQTGGIDGIRDKDYQNLLYQHHFKVMETKNCIQPFRAKLQDQDMV